MLNMQKHMIFHYKFLSIKKMDIILQSVTQMSTL